MTKSLFGLDAILIMFRAQQRNFVKLFKMLAIPYQDDQGTPTLFNTHKEYVHWTNWDPARTHRELSHLACAYDVRRTL